MSSVEVTNKEAEANNKKKSHHHRRRKKAAAPSASNGNNDEPSTSTSTIPDVEIEYVVEKPSDVDPALSDVFDRLGRIKAEGSENTFSLTPISAEAAVANILDSLAEDLGKDASKKELKKKTRPTVAQLKQIVSRPAIVEVHDIASPDPEMLVYLKSRRNTVPVPRHWSTSTRFLSGKRGSDKKPYQLPDYIANTGIGKLREASDDTNASLQQRQRERARPKLGRIEIDYQVLYDAFFKYQTKPRLTKHGELYYEGKEQEKDYSKFFPGLLSDELRLALGMPTVAKDGAQAAETYPPPWLSNMQRVGPPPSYPMVKFPGVNAPLPAGAQFGTAPGQWGKPPLDQYGRGIYGDVMGSAAPEIKISDAPVKLWGDFQHFDADDNGDNRKKRARIEEEEEEAVTEDEEEPAVPVAPQAPERRTEPAKAESLVPDEIVDLRKKPLQAHKVLEKQSANAAASNDVFGASHKYAMNRDREVAVAITPEALDSGMDKKDIEKLYEDERARTKIAMGVAPGAGHVDITEIEKEVAKKNMSKDKKAKGTSKKDFKF